MQKENLRKLVLVGIFAIAMAFVESTVVVYLRKLYYPNDVLFPLNTSMPGSILAIEWVRELSTIIMLLAVAFLAGKKSREKFSYFIYSFAIWDIFYYIWLKVMVNWPASILDWDILFLIPVTWVSPVLAPIIVSITMIVLALVILKFPKEKVKLREWILLALGAIIIYVSFAWDYSLLVLKRGFLARFAELSIGPELIKNLSEYVPRSFNWGLFVLGEALAFIGILLFYFRARKS